MSSANLGNSGEALGKIVGELFRADRIHPGKAPGLNSSFDNSQAYSAPPVHSTLEPLSNGPTAQEARAGENYAFGDPHGYMTGDGFNFRGVPMGGKPQADLAESSSPGHFYFLPTEITKESALPGTAEKASPASPFDIGKVRRDFPILQERVHGKPLVWLDNAATTQKPQAVIDALSQFYSHDNSNIHRAAHTLAARATDAFEKGRDTTARFLGAKSSKEIVFVRGTTEGINLIAQTYGRKFIGSGDEILLTTMEHHANIVPWQMLAEQTGAVIRVVPINDRGELIMEQFAALLCPRTKIVAVTHVANSIGTVNPVEQIIALAHSFGVPVLIDGAQSTPHLPVNVTALDADFYVFSGHKIFGPTGIGAVYGKSEWLEQLPPWQGGGHMIKDVTFAKTTYQNAPEKFEAGTPNIAGVVGMGAAMEYMMQLGIPALAAYEHDLLVYATEAMATVPGLRPIGTAAAKASVLSFVLKDLSVAQVAQHLDKQGIAVRAGHHCAMPTLRRFGLEATVRPALAFYNTRAEIDLLVSSLRQLVRK